VRVSELSSEQIPFALSSTDYFWDGVKEASKMEMPGMVLQKSYFDGASGYTFSMQNGREDLKAEEVAAKQKASGLIAELNYKAKGMTYELKGIETIDGQDCYVLYTTDGQAENYDYFTTNTFMKVRSTNLRKAGDELVETTTSFSDFKLVSGMMFAHSFSMSVGKMTLNGIVKTIEVNPKEVLPTDF
jgi:hypothetical protein